MLGLGWIQGSKEITRDRPWDGIHGSRLVLGRVFIWGGALAFLVSITIASWLERSGRSANGDESFITVFCLATIFLYFLVHLAADHPRVPRWILAFVTFVLGAGLFALPFADEFVPSESAVFLIYAAYFLVVSLVSGTQAFVVPKAKSEVTDT